MTNLFLLEADMPRSKHLLMYSMMSDICVFVIIDLKLCFFGEGRMVANQNGALSF